MVNDGAAFLVNVINDPVFRSTGVLYATEPGGAWGLHWVVIDPRRHQLFTWKKNQVDFVAAAAALGASVVTNGPFFSYQGGTKYWATFRVSVRSIFELNAALVLNLVSPGLGGLKTATTLSNINNSMINNYSADFPVGHIHGAWGSETSHGAPAGYYFGRFNGRQFRHYAIGRGDPPANPEVIGGLPAAVLNYTPVTTVALTNQHGFWGLAPIDPTDTIWQQHGLQLPMQQALDSLHQYENTEEKELPALDGLLVTAFQSITPAAMAAMLAGVLVKDAVQLDGADSVLLGTWGTIHVGNSMVTPKRYGNTWGFITIKS